ncbi:MAG TPA: tRNA (adenosine(37)-N6)-threonylcarbamoyltransferase complex dimerization subunit type 1 TsaB [Pseudolysinimonas sp.]
MLLAIDTSAGTSVAVVDGGRVLSEASDPGARGHAEQIGILIERALADAQATPQDITGVVSGMGPGPFTGLRVGIAAARAFAAGRDIPVHPVASHDAVAFGRGLPTLVVTDARRREVAWSTYNKIGPSGLPVLLSGPHLAHPEDLATAVDGYATFDRIDATQISAASLGLVAELLLKAKRSTGPDQPLYLRAPDVTLPGAPKPTSQGRGTG